MTLQEKGVDLRRANITGRETGAKDSENQSSEVAYLDCY